MAKVIDVCTFNGEFDLWDIHYNILKDYVDEFIVIEFDKTFSGNSKSPIFQARPYDTNKVTYCFHQLEDYAKYRDLALDSPNTVGASHWKMEFMQKESIRDALTHLDDNDIVFIGDVDEIWHPSLASYGPNGKTAKLGLRVYTYYLNNRSSEEFYGPIFTYYSAIKDKCLNHVRTNPAYFDYIPNAGWHFTSMGGYEEVKRKLRDSYTEESYWNPVVEQNLQDNMAQNKDFLGRDFTYTQDESEWPEYLQVNKDKYLHLCRP